MSKRLFALLLLLASPALWAASLPPAEPVPGGIAIVPLPASGPTAPAARYHGDRVLVVRSGHDWRAVVGIPLGAKPGPQQLTLTGRDGRQSTVVFRIHAKTYASQHITLKNKHMVNPTKQELNRIWREEKAIHAALRTWRASPAVVLRLKPPIHGIRTSPFGLRRFFNGEPRRPHSGIDIAAPLGTPIHAPAPARVVLTGHFFFDGNCVFLDHGNGLVTMYAHMSKIEVKAGQRVKSGQVIGLVGATGRATGPHLHWGVSMNDARIDPDLLLAGKL